MSRKATIVLLLTLTVLASTAIIFTVDTTKIIAPDAPEQVYNPTVPAEDQKVVCIAFDDGWKTHLDTLPVLERYNFTASYAIVTSYIGYPAYLDWNDAAHVAQAGNDIVSHTVSHCNLSAVDETTLYQELVDSRDTLRSRGYGGDILIYPYGEAAKNETVRQAVAEIYKAAVSTQTGTCDLYKMDRYDINTYVIYHSTSLADFAAYLDATGHSKVTVLYYHKVSNEDTDNSITIEEFEAQMQYLSSNGYTVQTLSQLFLKEADETLQP